MNRKILIIDDDEQDQKIIRKFFKSLGFENLVFAGDGYQGLELIINENPDLVILDLMLPVGGGLGLLKNLEAKIDIRNTPVIVYTGNTDPVKKQEALSFGIKAYVQKTSDGSKLMAAVLDTFRQNEY